MSSIGGSVSIAASDYQSQVYNKKHFGLGLCVYIPLGFQGVLAIRVCDTEDGTFQPIYDDAGDLIQIDPTSLTLPVWHVIKADIMPAHFIMFESYTDTTEGTPQNQSADRQLRLMGTS